MSSKLDPECRWVAMEGRRAFTTSTIELRWLIIPSRLACRKLFLELAGLDGRLSEIVLVGEPTCGDFAFDFLGFSFDRVREAFGGLGVDFSPLSSLSLMLCTAARSCVIHSVIKLGFSNTRYQA
jgi:hypothetical protein